MTARRPDGFHDLASLFQVIDLGDTLELQPLPSSASEDSLSCGAPGVPEDASNLVLRALALYRRRTGLSRRFRVLLQKRIPHGAGLGGGSGNCATALWAVDAWTRLHEARGEGASAEDLALWGGELGSDVPVFFSQGSAYCTGRGEIVRSVPPPLSLSTPLLLVKPAPGLPTPAVFRALDLGSRSDADPEQLLAALSSHRRARQELCVNDLQAPAESLLPEVAHLRRELLDSRAFDAVFVSGSGSTVVGLGSDAPPASLAGVLRGKTVVRARMIQRAEGEWYRPPVRHDAAVMRAS